MYRLALAFLFACGAVAHATPLPDGTPVRGWTILSDSEPDDAITLAAAKRYNINHVQLSHEIVHDLIQIKDEKRCALVNRLTDAAHAAGVTEVVLWDHVFNNLDYYPAEFRTGPGGTIDLDNDKFWDWLKADYRNMLDKVPHADGLVLTFIETGARAEKQFSNKLKTNQEKIAAVVDAVADVVINERIFNLYARTFAYTDAEYGNIIGAINQFKNKNIRIMMKETPHDFFLTHPNDKYAGTIPRPTIIEFDGAGEFNGQGVIAITWPQYILHRWSELAKRDHVIGYTVRTDRYRDTRLVGTPNEINLFTLAKAADNPDISPDKIYDEFITARYGAASLPHLKPAFQNAFDIVSSTIYTLGTNVANHSALDYEPYRSSYGLHVSGKWWDPPISRIKHNVNKDLHYYADVLDHIAPAFVKAPGNKQFDEVPWVVKAGWLHPSESMNEQYLRWIITEKSYGVALAVDSLKQIEEARPVLKPEDYTQLHQLFERTLLTARLHHAAASAYYGFRVWSRGKEFQTDYVTQTTNAGLNEITEVAALIDEAPPAPRGQWNWKGDVDNARKYFQEIVVDGWPAKVGNFDNSNAGMKFPLTPTKPAP